MWTGKISRYAVALVSAVLVLLVITPAVAEAPIEVWVDGQPLVMDVAPVVVGGRTMVPARFVAEALGATVSWDSVGRRVIVTSGAKPIPETPLPEVIYQEGKAYMRAKALTELLRANAGGQAVEFDARGVVRVNSREYTLSQILHRGVSFYDIGPLLVESLRVPAHDSSTLPKPLTTQATTSDASPPVRQTVSVRSAVVGENLPFRNMVVTVKGIRYADKWGDSRPGDGERFAIVSLWVDTGTVSVDPVMSPAGLVSKWQLASGETGVESFIAGTVAPLRQNENRSVEIGRAIPETEIVTAVTIVSPYADDIGTSYIVAIP